ncbi:unnamed protein product, partial [Closterium sp. Yama58-4]
GGSKGAAVQGNGGRGYVKPRSGRVGEGGERRAGKRGNAGESGGGGISGVRVRWGLLGLAAKGVERGMERARGAGRGGVGGVGVNGRLAGVRLKPSATADVADPVTDNGIISDITLDPQAIADVSLLLALCSQDASLVQADLTTPAALDVSAPARTLSSASSPLDPEAHPLVASLLADGGVGGGEGGVGVQQAEVRVGGDGSVQVSASVGGMESTVLLRADSTGTLVMAVGGATAGQAPAAVAAAEGAEASAVAAGGVEGSSLPAASPQPLATPASTETALGQSVLPLWGWLGGREPAREALAEAAAQLAAIRSKLPSASPPASPTSPPELSPSTSLAPASPPAPPASAPTLAPTENAAFVAGGRAEEEASGEEEKQKQLLSAVDVPAVPAVAEPSVTEEKREDSSQGMGVEGAQRETAEGTLVVRPGAGERAGFESTAFFSVDARVGEKLAQQGSSNNNSNSSRGGVLHGLQEQLSGLSPFASAIRALTGVSLWGGGQRVAGGMTEAQVREQLEELRRKREARRAGAEGLNAALAGLNSQMVDLQTTLQENKQAVTEQKKILTRGIALRPKVETAGPPSAVEGDKSKLTASGAEMSARHHLAADCSLLYARPTPSTPNITASTAGRQSPSVITPVPPVIEFLEISSPFLSQQIYFLLSPVSSCSTLAIRAFGTDIDNMAILAVQPSTPHCLVDKKSSYVVSHAISPVEDCDILSPIIDSISCIHENKENLELGSFEERLVDAFCRGTLDAEVPQAIDDIIALAQRLSLSHGDTHARDTSVASDADSPVSVVRRSPLNDISSIHSDDDDQVSLGNRSLRGKDAVLTRE